MKILFYISTIASGGAARVMTNLANELSNRGHNCELVTTFAADVEYSISDSVKRRSLYKTKPNGNWFFTNYNIMIKLRKEVLSEKPDILVSFLGEPNIRAALATIGTKTKTVLSVRNDPNWEYRGFLQTFLAKYLFRRVDGIVFQTEDAKAWFPQCIQKKSEIIFNSVKEDFYSVELPKENYGIVATGRLSKQKNHSLLIRAFAEIADKVKDDLTIYGAGDFGNLRQLAIDLGVGDRVKFPGQTTDVKNAIKGSKLYVLSSDFEGMPNALMEAMAMGLPCVSTDCPCGGPRSLFTKEMGKYLTPVKDVDALASAMLVLLSNEERRNEHATCCREAAKTFHPNLINSKWEEYIEHVLHKN